MSDLHKTLNAAAQGDRQAAAQLLSLVYDALRKHDLDGLELAAPAATDAADVLALHEALDKLAALSPRRAELVKLRYFVGLTVPEAAEVLGVALSTAEGDWTYARAWLLTEMSPGAPDT